MGCSGTNLRNNYAASSTFAIVFTQYAFIFTQKAKYLVDSGDFKLVGMRTTRPSQKRWNCINRMLWDELV